MRRAANTIGRFALLLWLVLGCGGVAGCMQERTEALPSGLELGQGVVLVGARTYPVEPMSPTSGRCALRLEHRASATWLEVFPQAGWQRPAGIDNGDVHFADGRQQMKPPAPLAPAYGAALAELRRRIAPLTGDQVVAQCRARDPQRPSGSRFALSGALALLLLVGAVLIRRRAGGLSLALALIGLGGLLWTAWPVLGGESFGSQELQRLLSSLRPFGELLAGHDGDARHPAGLYLAYATVARFTGTVFGLRLFGFALTALAFTAWVAARWRRNPGEVLVGLALLVHPVLLKNSLEVGPYAFYVAGMLALWLAVGGREELSRLRFALGLVALLALAAVNHVATAVAPALLLVAVVRSRGGISRAELGLRLAAVALVMLPFVVALVSALSGEPALRQAAGRTPELAWGSRPFWMLSGGLARSVFVGALPVVVGVLVVALGWSGRRTHWDGLALVGLGLLTVVALAALSPWFRVQPYYALYGLVPLLLGLGRLVSSVSYRPVSIALGLLCLVVTLLELVRLGPPLARRRAEPRPARVVAKKALAQARACPILLSATNDLTLPLMPHLVDLRRVGRSRAAPRLGGTPSARSWRLPRAGLTLLSLYGRHQLPPAHVDQLVQRLAALSRAGCVQVLYDRRFPLPRLYRLLQRQCRRSARGGPYRLYCCAQRVP